MDRADLFLEGQLDYLDELLNISAGSAVTALSALLNCTVNMKPTLMLVAPPWKAVSSMGDPAAPVVCAKMSMQGDLTGWMFFIVPERDKCRLAHAAETSLTGCAAQCPGHARSVSTIAEIANILAGAYLTALYEVCGLSAYHTVPTTAVDMMEALLDETIGTCAMRSATSIIICHDFLIGNECAKALLLILPARESLALAVDPIVEKHYG